MLLPRISVITICFNAEKHIRSTLESVINQNYPNLEYVVIDGRSTDGTGKILAEYQDKIDIIVSEPDDGLYDAMNKGLKWATGDYILFMNAGDSFYENDTLSAMVELGADADFVYGKPLVIEEEGNTYEWHKIIPEKIEDSSPFLMGMVVCHQAMLVRKSLAPEFDLKWKISADLDWVIKIIEKSNRNVFFDGHVCKYLQGGLSNRRKWKAITERFRICLRHFGLFRTLVSQFKIIGQSVSRSR